MNLPLLPSTFEILAIHFARSYLQKVKSFDSNFAICFCVIGVLFYLFYFFFGVVFLRRSDCYWVLFRLMLVVEFCEEEQEEDNWNRNLMISEKMDSVKDCVL